MQRYTIKDHEAYRKEQDEKAAKEEEARNERTEKASARRAWLSDGGREADFEKEWPKLRARGEKPGVSAWHLASGEFPVDGKCRKEFIASRYTLGRYTPNTPRVGVEGVYASLACNELGGA
jgi:hypothetical protein